MRPQRVTIETLALVQSVAHVSLCITVRRPGAFNVLATEAQRSVVARWGRSNRYRIRRIPAGIVSPKKGHAIIWQRRLAWPLAAGIDATLGLEPTNNVAEELDC